MAAVATSLAAARQHIRDTLATITIAGGYDVTIKSAEGKANENALKTPDSKLPKAWVLSPEWTIKHGTTWNSGSVTMKVNVDIWLLAGTVEGAAEDYEVLLDAVIVAFCSSIIPAGMRIRFAEEPSIPELSADGRAILRIPMQIEVPFSLR